MIKFVVDLLAKIIFIYFSQFFLTPFAVKREGFSFIDFLKV